MKLLERQYERQKPTLKIFPNTFTQARNNETTLHRIKTEWDVKEVSAFPSTFNSQSEVTVPLKLATRPTSSKKNEQFQPASLEELRRYRESLISINQFLRQQITENTQWKTKRNFKVTVNSLKDRIAQLKGDNQRKRGQIQSMWQQLTGPKLALDNLVEKPSVKTSRKVIKAKPSRTIGSCRLCY